MGIPTGAMKVTATASRKAFIYYVCPKCGQASLYEHELTQEAEGAYHVFQSADTKNNVQNTARAKAQSLLEQEDYELYNNINFNHKYDVKIKKIKCPHCQEAQPWSGIPRPWFKSKYLWMWFIGIMFTFLPLMISPYFIFIPILWLLLPLFRFIRRKAALNKLSKATFIPPIYYNLVNIGNLIESPDAWLLQDLLNKQSK